MSVIDKMNNFRKARAAESGIERANKRSQRRKIFQDRLKGAIKIVVRHLIIYTVSFAGIIIFIIIICACAWAVLNDREKLIQLLTTILS